MSRSGRPALEKILERFFTLWAWQWELDVLPEFPAFLGEFLWNKISYYKLSFSAISGSPYHLHHAAVTSILSDFYDDVPTKFAPILLSLAPPCIFPPRTSSPHVPTSLYDQLFLVAPPPPPPPPSALPTPARNPSNASQTIVAPRPRLGFDLISPHLTNTLLPALTNPKKWAWPGYLTMGKVGGASDPPREAPGLNALLESLHERPKSSQPEVHAAEAVKSPAKPTDSNATQELAHTVTNPASSEVDQSALRDAMGILSPTEGEGAEPVKPWTETIVPTAMEAPDGQIEVRFEVNPSSPTRATFTEYNEAFVEEASMPPSLASPPSSQPPPSQAPQTPPSTSSSDASPTTPKGRPLPDFMMTPVVPAPVFSALNVYLSPENDAVSEESVVRRKTLYLTVVPSPQGYHVNWRLTFGILNRTLASFLRSYCPKERT